MVHNIDAVRVMKYNPCQGKRKLSKNNASSYNISDREHPDPITGLNITIRRVNGNDLKRDFV